VENAALSWGFAVSYNSDAPLIAVPVPRYDFARCRISRNSGSASKTISPSQRQRQQQRGALMTRASRNFNSRCDRRRTLYLDAHVRARLDG